MTKYWILHSQIIVVSSSQRKFPNTCYCKDPNSKLLRCKQWEWFESMFNKSSWNTSDTDLQILKYSVSSNNYQIRTNEHLRKTSDTNNHFLLLSCMFSSPLWRFNFFYMDTDCRLLIYSSLLDEGLANCTTCGSDFIICSLHNIVSTPDLNYLGKQ